MSSSIIPTINERSRFAVTKSVQDPTQATATATATATTKKKKYTVLAAAAVMLSATGFAVTQYHPSSSGDNGRGGGIRASVDTVDGLLLLTSSVDLRSDSDGKCNPASGTWGGKSFQRAGDTPYETCFQNEYTKEECWSKSYFDGGDIGGWQECFPTGGDWHFLNSGAATSTCGSPCQQFCPTDDDY